MVSVSKTQPIQKPDYCPDETGIWGKTMVPVELNNDLMIVGTAPIW